MASPEEKAQCVSWFIETKYADYGVMLKILEVYGTKMRNINNLKPKITEPLMRLCYSGHAEKSSTVLILRATNGAHRFIK